LQASKQERLSAEAVSLEPGTVQFVSDERCVVVTERGVSQALQAASCLLKPEAGDRVLVSIVDGLAYVLAVLEKSAEDSQILLPGNVTLQAKGQLLFSAAQDMQLIAGQTMNQTAMKINTLAGEQRLTAGRMDVAATTLSVTSHDIEAQAEQFHGVITRIFQRADQVMRWVETIETLNIGNWVQNVRDTLHSRADNQIITARSDVKVDAKRIHMG